jgi:hypothetical protein
MKIELGLRDQRRAYRPLEFVEGAVLWEMDAPPKLAEVRLLWFTRGKGTEDGMTVASEKFGGPRPGDTRTFKLQIPEAPYSFSGRLISLIWAVEFVLTPGNHFERIEIVVGPEGKEILLPAEEKKK